MGECTSIDLVDGERDYRTEIVNNTDGPMLVWAGQAHLATLKPGEEAAFEPSAGEYGWRRTRMSTGQ